MHLGVSRSSIMIVGGVPLCLYCANGMLEYGYPSPCEAI